MHGINKGASIANPDGEEHVMDYVNEAEWERGQTLGQDGDYPQLEEPPKAASGSVINRLFNLEQMTQLQHNEIQQLQADIGKICEIVGVKL